MKKIKKIAASIMAVAAMATSMVGISASAYQVSQSKATFTWYRGYACMKNNNPTQTRFASASVELFNNVTGERVDWDQHSASLGYNASVSASFSTNTGNYSWTSSGYICNGNTIYAPHDWDPNYNP